MIVQYTAAALVNDNKGLAWPSSVDSIPTSAGQEDHVSMGMTSANNLAPRAGQRRGRAGVRAARRLRGDRFSPPAALGRGTQAAYAARRERIAPWTEDRSPAPDIAAARELIASGRLTSAAEAAIGHRLTT